MNTFTLLKYLDQKKLNENEIICYGVKQTKAVRNKKSKWYLSLEEYPDKMLGRYCPGFFFLMKGSLIASLYKESAYVKFFWIDDYWLTNMVASRLNVTLVFNNKQIILEPFRIKNFNKQQENILVVHMFQNLNKMNDYWLITFDNHFNKYQKHNRSNYFEEYNIFCC